MRRDAIAWVIAAAVFIGGTLELGGGRLGPRLLWDDAYIYLATARTLHERGVMAVSPEHPPLAAVTSPLQVLLLTGTMPLTDLETGALVLSFAASLLLLALLYLLLRDLLVDLPFSRAVCLLFVLVVAWAGRTALNALGGMETALYAALFLGSIRLYRRHGPSLRAGAPAALLAVIRPDGVVMPGILAACEGWRWLARRDARGLRRLTSFAAPMVVLCALQCLLFLAFSGQLVPTSVSARPAIVGDLCRPLPVKVAAALGHLAVLLADIRHLALLGSLGVLTQWLTRRDLRLRLLLLAYLAVLLSAYTYLHPAGMRTYAGRYLVTCHLTVVVLSACALGDLHALLRARAPRLARAAPLVAVALLPTISYGPLRAERERLRRVDLAVFAPSVDEYAASVRALERHTPAGARIGLTDIGTPLYFMRERYTFDLFGLANPEMADYFRDPRTGGCLPLGRRSLADVPARFDLDYVALLPARLPLLRLFAPAKTGLEEIDVGSRGIHLYRRK